MQSPTSYKYKFGGHFKKPRWSIKTAANRLGNTVIDYRKGHNSLTMIHLGPRTSGNIYQIITVT